MKNVDAATSGRIDVHQPGTMLFQVDRLSKQFGRIAALAEVSFSVRAGEVLGLIGPNGAGKTTLFECLAGILPVDAGGIRVDDRPITSRERAALLFYLPDGIALTSVGHSAEFLSSWGRSVRRCQLTLNGRRLYGSFSLPTGDQADWRRH